MENNLEIFDAELSFLTELSKGELQQITGGDKFMKDLGYFFGYLWEGIKEGAAVGGGIAL